MSLPISESFPTEQQASEGSRDPLVVHEFGSPSDPALVLLHGLTEAGTAWPDAVRRWASRWYIYAPDQRGHGQSPRFRPDETAPSMDIWVEDLLALSWPDRPIVVGHSLGGRVALAAALSEPHRLAALILEDPALTAWDRAPGEFIVEQERFLGSFEGAGRENQCARMRAESSWTDEEITAWADCKPRVDPDMVRNLHMGGIDGIRALNALTVPTLLILPQGSELVPHPERITNPMIRTVTVSDAGHCVRRDNATSYHREVDAFLDEHRVETRAGD